MANCVLKMMNLLQMHRTEPERTGDTAYLIVPFSAHNQSFHNFIIHSFPPAGSLLLDLGRFCIKIMILQSNTRILQRDFNRKCRFFY